MGVRCQVSVWLPYRASVSQSRRGSAMYATPRVPPRGEEGTFFLRYLFFQIPRLWPPSQYGSPAHSTGLRCGGGLGKISLERGRFFSS